MALYVQLDGHAQADITLPGADDELAKPLDELRDKALVHVFADQVQQVMVQNAGGPKIVLQKTAGKWRETEPQSFAADADVMNALLRSLTGLDVSAFVKSSVSSATHLNEPQVTVSFSTTQPSTQPTTQPTASADITTIKLGQYDNIRKENVYAMVSDSGEVVKVAASHLDDFKKSPIDFRDKNLVLINLDLVDRFKISVSRKATTQPTSQPADVHEYVIERRKETPATLGPALPPGLTIPAPATQPALPTTRPAGDGASKMTPATQPAPATTQALHDHANANTAAPMAATRSPANIDLIGLPELFETSSRKFASLVSLIASDPALPVNPPTDGSIVPPIPATAPSVPATQPATPATQPTDVATTTQPATVPTTTATLAATQPASPTTQPTDVATTQPSTLATTMPSIAATQPALPTTPPTDVATTQPSTIPASLPSIAATQPALPSTQPTDVATTQPSTLPTTMPSVATTQPATPADVAMTQPATSPATQPSIATTQPSTVSTPPVAVAPAGPPSKWLFASGQSGDAEEGQVNALLDTFKSLRVEKYIEPGTFQGNTYTLVIHAIAAKAGEKETDYTFTFIDTGTRVIGSYNGITFEADRGLIDKLGGDFKTKKPPPPPPARMPSFPGMGGMNGMGGGPPPGE